VQSPRAYAGEGSSRPVEAGLRGAEDRLWVAGDGPERPALAAQVEALGLARQVRFLGQRDDVGDLLAACDVVVLSSRREGLGVAAAREGMAAGRWAPAPSAASPMPSRMATAACWCRRTAWPAWPRRWTRCCTIARCAPSSAPPLPSA
jgi:glycosyltransferase involved in cell wall biosynthesis